ncbi:MAG: bifunctional demethylmenaquinone methyltransferase/2-methoxy-6-polyprenyl-1,4-benzoquinol methylase UbiE [Desulfobacteraceae bacterium]|nr:MAG: bifunctional demethylmenaquinone methyltransferase/2-methoxy-6-polyprenyl-1,4-benzoquinol methylase UbiE [Desulfobacteraceae bacterium]
MKNYPKLDQIDSSEHIRLVKQVFQTIPKRYDFLNHFLSLWQDVLWRRFTIKQTGVTGKKRLLDVAIGTGDLALYARKENPDLQVSGLDFSPEMLALCDRKIKGKGLSDRICLIRGDALALPFPDHCFDVLTIGFGIRNIPDKPGALKEMQRVVRSGGRVLILEMGMPASRIFKFLYGFYLRYFMPFIARLFSPNPEAYDYLAESIRHFPTPQDFQALMHQAGLKNLKIHTLSFGITYLFIAEK